ncbi:MAG: retention module-containing protein, partial [Sinimarinibacterium sp.]
MATAIIGTVRTLQGLVEVRSADGKSTRALQVGDELHEGEIVLTGGIGRVEIVFADGTVVPIGPGQQVSITAELSDVEYPGADEAQVASVDNVVQAVLDGGDLDRLLEATAAGAGAAQGDGHGFVRLLRIVEEAAPPQGDTDAGLLAQGALPEDATLTLVPNQPPVAVDDAIDTPEDTPITIPVLGNDSDIDGDPLTITDVTQGVNGTVTIGADGNVIYTPNPGFNGSDSFTYTVSDGNGGTDTATVTVNVGAVNDAPDAVDDVVGTPEDTPITIPVLVNDSDPDGDPLTVTGVTQGANGTVTIGPDGNPIYTPNEGFNGTDSFTYTISDGQGGSDTATVTVNVESVNDGPDAVDDTVNTPEETPITIPVLVNDSDPDGDPLTVTGVTQGANGTVTIGPDGNPTYTPNAGFNGSDSFTYSISDGNGGTDTATVTVNVGGVNDPPAGTELPDQTSNDADFVSGVSVAGAFSDADGDTLTYSATGLPPGLSIDSDTGVISGTIDHSASDLSNDDNNTQAYTVSVTASDGSASATVDFTWTVNNTIPEFLSGTDTAATPPNADAYSFGANEGAAAGTAIGTVTAADADSDTLTYSIIGGNEDGLFAIDPATGTITLTQTVGQDNLGGYSLEVQVSDSEGGIDIATVGITLNNVNDPPDAVNDAVNTPEETPITIPVLGNDSDPDSDPLTVTGVTQPSNGFVTLNPNGTVTYTPAEGFTGTDSFTYTISDGNGGTDTATVTVNVTPVNDPPDAVNDAAETGEDAAVTIAVLSNDSDPDGDNLTVTGVTQGANGSVAINPNGTVTYTPNPGFEGQDSFTYTIGDGNGGSDTATVNVVVAPDSIPNVTVTTEEGGAVVDESALASGTNAASDGESTSGSFDIST